MNDATAFAWVIEAPGQNYLGTREIGHHPEFYWTPDHTKAVRFISSAQADGVMMAVRRMEPKLWAFAANLGEARPVEHGWLRASPISQGDDHLELAAADNNHKALVEVLRPLIAKCVTYGWNGVESTMFRVTSAQAKALCDLDAALSSSIQPQGEERS